MEGTTRALEADGLFGHENVIEPERLGTRGAHAHRLPVTEQFHAFGLQ